MTLTSNYSQTYDPFSGPVYNLANFLTVGSPDHSAQLKALIAGKGAGTYLVPAGMTVNVPLQLGATAPQLRNRVYLVGQGPSSVIQITGYEANPGANYYAFGLDWNYQTEAVDGAGFRNLTLQGDGPGASQTWTNWQAAAVRVLTGPTLTHNNLVFQDVIFLNHDGFPLHCDSNYQMNQHAMIERCQFINCGNGLNYNAAFATVRHCYFTNTEGIENSGPGNVIDGNIFLNLLAGAISVGGDQSTGPALKALPGTRVVNNQIFGTGSTGPAIILAQSSPDNLVANNYIERAAVAAIQTSPQSSYGPNDGALILGNHVVNAQSTGAGPGIYINSNNASVIGNRVYNRAVSAGDPWPLGAYKMTTGIALVASTNTLIEGNYVDMSNGGQYPLDFGSTPTGIIVGRNTFIPGSGYANFRYTNAATFTDAAGLLQGVVSGGNPAAVTSLATYRTIRLTSPGINRTGTLLSAVGRAGLQQTFVNTDPTFTLALTPNGTEQINGVNAAKTLGVNSAVTLTSDGSNWLAQVHYGTFS